MVVTAEGVEMAPQMQALHAMGCDVVQGYLLARPLPAAEAKAALDRQWTASR